MASARSARRCAGVSVPLFSLRSSRSWGIGEFGDLPLMTAWLRSAHQSVLQLLPLSELAPDEHSPYSGLSAMAIDPQYISLRLLEDFSESGINARAWEGILEAVQSSDRIYYQTLRPLKRAALVAAFARFYEVEWLHDSARAAALQRYLEEQHWWIADYGLYRALRARAGERPWMAWEPPLRGRDPDALAAATEELSREILFYQYLQWVAEEQWQTARREIPEVTIFGDFPFLVGLDSVDVWARQDAFMLDASVGTPPDAFSETGQDWGLPPYWWDSETDLDWFKLRTHRTAALYDGFRVDHLVGFYRTYVRPLDGRRPFFLPSEEAAQRAQGERLMGLFSASGVRITVEDLGIVPEFVRASVARLGLPGYRVLRWEREHRQAGRPFIDPLSYPAVSVATTGTHDTEPLAVWWETLPAVDRLSLGQVPSLAALHPDRAAGFERPEFDARLRDTILSALYAAGSDSVILPIQDVFGWRDRINKPATVGEWNWTFLLPWPVERLAVEREPVERAAALSTWSDRNARWIAEN